MTTPWTRINPHIRASIFTAATTLAVSCGVLIAATLVAVAITAPTAYDPSSGGYIFLDVPDTGQATSRLAAYCWPVIVLGTAGAGLLGWRNSRNSLHPLRAAAATLNELNDQHLDTRLVVPRARGEVQDTIVAVNKILGRLQEGFADGTRFAANASHELRTPLTASRTILQVALKTERDDDTITVLNRLLHINDRMVGITGALLDLAVAENELTTTRVELNALIAEAITLLEPDIAERHLKLHLKLDTVTIAGHEQLLRQLVTNLVRNAVIHNNPYGALAITLHAGQHPTLAIENDGAYIPPGTITALIQPFARMENRTHDRAGAGLGLAIVSRITQAHHATLTLTGRPRGGLIAEVTFPIQTPSPPTERA